MIDLRDHLQRLAELGELLEIEEEVNWNLEAPALCAMSNRAGGQAVHFKKVKGYAGNYTLAGSLLTGPGTYYPHKRCLWGRFAAGLGLDPKIGYEDLIATLLEREKNPILPVEVSDAPCKEVVRIGDEADILEFPIPFLHEGDGGRYGTGHILITKDLDSDWQNWGVYKWMVLGPRRLVSGFPVGKDLPAIFRNYKAAGRPMPCCIAIGGAPAVLVAAAMTLPPGTTEAEYAGGLNLDPINLIKAETNNLLVPGDAEIIIEGEFLPDETAEEGPFCAVDGYTSRSPQPVFRVTAITCRKDAILPFIVDGTKVSDTQVLLSLLESARLTRLCVEEAQHPVRWINLPVDYNLGICMVSSHKFYYGWAFRTVRYLFTRSRFFDKIVLVDADVDPIDLHTIINDIAQKCHPVKDHHYMKNMPPTIFNHYVSPEDMEAGVAGTNLYMDATWPVIWAKEDIPIPVTFETVFPKDIQDRVVERWKRDFGFEMDAVVRSARQKG